MIQREKVYKASSEQTNLRDMVAEDQLQRTVCRACTPKENLRLGLKIHKSTSGVLGEKERKENQRWLLEKNCLRKSHMSGIQPNILAFPL